MSIHGKRLTSIQLTVQVRTIAIATVRRAHIIFVPGMSTLTLIFRLPSPGVT